MKTFKYFAMTLMAACFFTAASAQDDGGDKHKKGQSGDISIGFNYSLAPNINIGGLLGGGGAGAPSVGNQWRNDAFGNAQIFGRYYLSNDLALRVGLGINSYSTTNVSKDSSMWTESVNTGDTLVGVPAVDSGAYSETTTESGQFNFSISPGIEKHISTNSNIDPYVGAQIPLAFLGSVDSTTTIEREGYPVSGSTNKHEFSSESTTTTPGGFGWGVQGIVGFNWFLGDKVAIGMEYKLGFMHTSTGGEVTGDTERSLKNNSGTYESSGSSWNHQTENTNNSFSTMSSGGINVSIFF